MTKKGPSPGVASPLQFAPGVVENLGYYVYALRDPGMTGLFYVGKGKGNRVFQRAIGSSTAGSSAGAP